MSMRKRARTISMAAEMEPLVKDVESQQERQLNHHHQVALFLKACGFCKSSFLPGKDIYVYKGEIAFCSVECREERIKYDEWKEKCSLYEVKTKAYELSSARGPEASDNKGKNVDIGPSK